MPNVVSLADLGIDKDPGTAWHPRGDKDGVRDDNGDLLDLTEDELADHRQKPEAVDAEGILAAEDSLESPEGVV